MPALLLIESAQNGPFIMFSQLARQPEESTRFFGHLLLPGGSANLGEPRYALGVPGSEAPAIGVLMQTRRVTPLPTTISGAASRSPVMSSSSARTATTTADPPLARRTSS